MAEYHSTDFDFYEWAVEAATLYALPSIVSATDSLQKPSSEWNNFFELHDSGSFFKPRKYLALEFNDYLSLDDVVAVAEVGCGHGCSMFPLLEKFPFKYIASDYSQKALEILQTHPKYDPSRSTVVQWDVTSCKATVNHLPSLQNMMSGLTAGGVVLFRDYGVHDMTMYRHSIRLEEHLFQRPDGTLAYYFELEYLRNLCELAGLEVLELSYATVEICNRKQNSKMKRVFVHGVFRKN